MTSAPGFAVNVRTNLLGFFLYLQGCCVWALHLSVSKLVLFSALLISCHPPSRTQINFLLTNFPSCSFQMIRFCIEVTRTLVEQGVPFAYYRIDLFSGGDGNITQATAHEALRNLTNQRTVPYVFVNGNLLGGCDATKELISTGEFDKMLGANPATNGTGTVNVDLELGSDAKTPMKTVGVDEDSTKITGALLEFPNTVDGRVIRLVAVQVFILSTLLAILAYKKNQSWHWVAVGLLTDFCLRFYGGAGISPLGSIAMFAVAFWDLIGPRVFGRQTGPLWGAGPPKQFAVSVGMFFSAGIVIFQFTHVWQAATVFAAVLSFFSFLEWALNFCAGCWVFGHAIHFKVIPESVYIVHINTLPETKLTWDDFTKTVNPPTPQRYRENFRDYPRPTKIDLHYKTGKTTDWEREDFDYIKHSKIAFFSSVIGVAAIPALFKFMAMSPRFQTSNLIWQVLTLLSLVYTSFFTFPYIMKMIKYPQKIKSEWQHPMMNNAFGIPSMTIIVYAFLATGNYSTALARVLFWAGSSTAFLLSIIIIGNLLSTIRHPGHLNGAWQMAPVGLYIASVVGPIVDARYTQVSFLFFGFASIMYVTLFIMTFQNVAINYLADPRQRMFSAIWFAAPSVASIAWTVLNAPTAATAGMYVMDPIAQTLFYIGISMAVLNLWMSWRRFLWTDKFFMQMWAFGFPTAALAWAAVLYDGTIQTALTKVLALLCISVACVIAFVLTMRTFVGVARLKVFIPEHKWGPMSHLPLFQDAARNLLARIGTTTEALAEDPSNTRLKSSLRTSWTNFTTINTFYSTIKKDICLPQIGDFFPGHQAQALANNAKMIEEQNKIDALLDKKTSTDFMALKTAMHEFIQLCYRTYDHVEDNIKPVVRRYIPGPVQKKIMVDCWDDAPKEGWWATIPVVVQNLPMQGQRLTYIRAFLWAMPERCQQIGTMVALGVDPVTWYRLKHQLPEIIPRGEAGWKRF
jgi:tellurite resistance protein